jgi:metal-sulfur cluster biosynthetic enzyme
MPDEVASLRDRVLGVLQHVVDPELGLSVVELGLVYRVDVTAPSDVQVDLTMTTPACPLGEAIVRDAEAQIRDLPDVTGVEVNLVWDPPWTPERMTNEAKKMLGW